jgi:hypothetical protein
LSANSCRSSPKRKFLDSNHADASNPLALFHLSGVDSHLDWDVSQFLSQNWQVGLVGYVYYQLTGDSGSGEHVGSFKSRVAAVGPEVGYSFTAGGLQWYANLRGYKEFWAENRLEGYALFAMPSIPLGGGPKNIAANLSRTLRGCRWIGPRSNSGPVS